MNPNRVARLGWTHANSNRDARAVFDGAIRRWRIVGGVPQFQAVVREADHDP